MKLILDFDDVLFNARGLKEVMFRILSEHGVMNGEELYNRERNKVGNIFLPKQFLVDAIKGMDIDDGDVVGDIDVEALYGEIMSECPTLVNQELVALIQSVGGENCYIISNGDQNFQMDKILATGLDKLVAKVIVVPGSKNMEIELICKEFPNEEVIFVDDKSIYFDDINREACPNLTTVTYDEHGQANLEAEISAGLLAEQKKYSPQIPMR